MKRIRIIERVAEFDPGRRHKKAKNTPER